MERRSSLIFGWSRSTTQAKIIHSLGNWSSRLRCYARIQLLDRQPKAQKQLFIPLQSRFEIFISAEDPIFAPTRWVRNGRNTRRSRLDTIRTGVFAITFHFSLGTEDTREDFGGGRVGSGVRLGMRLRGYLGLT